MKTLQQKNENRIARARVELGTVRDFALISGLTVAMPVKILEGFPTAMTDGRRISFGQEFLDALNPKQLNYVLAHEYMHAVFQHCRAHVPLVRKYGRVVVGQAGDYFVNLVVEECGGSVVERPTHIPPLYDPAFKGLSVAEICEVLIKTPRTGDTLDEHGDIKELLDSLGIEDEDMQEMINIDPAMQEELQRQVEQAISLGVQRAKQVSDDKLSASIERAVMALNTAPPWQKYVEEFMHSTMSGLGDDIDWRRPNRRMMAQGVYMPSRTSTTLSEVVLTVDVSGSMSDHDISKALADVRSLCNQYKIEKLHVLYWDCGVTKHEVFTDVQSDAALQDLQPEGGGSTAFGPVLTYMEENDIKPVFMVGWTDGYLNDWGSSSVHPSMWVMTTNVTPPWGQVIKFESGV